MSSAVCFYIVVLLVLLPDSMCSWYVYFLLYLSKNWSWASCSWSAELQQRVGEGCWWWWDKWGRAFWVGVVDNQQKSGNLWIFRVKEEVKRHSGYRPNRKDWLKFGSRVSSVLILLWKEQKMNSILFCESSIMSKWRAAARPATPWAYTLSSLYFYVDKRLGECDLCLIYFNSRNVEKTPNHPTLCCSL